MGKRARNREKRLKTVENLELGVARLQDLREHHTERIAKLDVKIELQKALVEAAIVKRNEREKAAATEEEAP